MELIFCNFSKREKRAEQNRGRRSQRKGGGRECVKKKKRGRNKWEKPGRGRRGRRNERSQAELFWTCYTTPSPSPLPPAPSIPPLRDLLARRRGLRKKKMGERKKGKHERRKEWRVVVVGGRREKRKIISYIRRPRCNGGYFALQNTRATTPSPTLSSLTRCSSLAVPRR